MSITDLPTETLATLTRVFTTSPELREVVLFESRAAGTATARSDIDLATRGIADDHCLRRLALDLDDLPIRQHCDVQPCKMISYAPLLRYMEVVGIVVRPTS